MTNGSVLPSRPRLLVVLSALLFSTAAPVTKFVAMPAISVSFYRSVVGIAALLALTIPGRGRSLFRFTWRNLLCGAAYASTSFCFFFAMRNTTAANATILFQTTPVFLIPLGFLFLGEKTDRWDILAIALMAAGIVLCFRGSVDTQGRSGDVIALGGAVSFAFMTILMRGSNFEGSIRGILVGNIVIALVALPFQFGAEPSVRDIVLAGSLGIVHMAVPFFIFSRALLALRALEASIYRNLETVAAPLWVALVVGEVPGFWTVIGFFCVLSALLLRALSHRAPSAGAGTADGRAGD